MISNNITKKKTKEEVKDELLNSLKVNDEVKETEINIADVIDPEEAVGLTNRYEEIIKTQHKRVITYIAKQGEILIKFKDVENVFVNVEQGSPTLYYKISLYKLFKKRPKLKNSRLP